MLKHRIYTKLFIGWMILITILCLIKLPVMEGPEIEMPYADKVVHFGFYFVASVLGSFFIRELLAGHLALFKTLGLVVGCLIAYGILIEVIQLVFTPWRSGEVADALANSLGALAGAGIVKLRFSGKGQLKWKN